MGVSKKIVMTKYNNKDESLVPDAVGMVWGDSSLQTTPDCPCTPPSRHMPSGTGTFLY